ncbi:hypothetical protein GY45DRAFT_702578 [Cubamyces sp. BRFM 1775]|nr:hypothetical protein GY45DRAFT_702578 [Cubamyces sp. BRFM 1775]
MIPWFICTVFTHPPPAIYLYLSHVMRNEITKRLDLPFRGPLAWLERNMCAAPRAKTVLAAPCLCCKLRDSRPAEVTLPSMTPRGPSGTEFAYDLGQSRWVQAQAVSTTDYIIMRIGLHGGSLVDVASATAASPQCRPRHLCGGSACTPVLSGIYRRSSIHRSILVMSRPPQS